MLIVQDARLGDRVERGEQLALPIYLPDVHKRRISAAVVLRERIPSAPLLGLPVHGSSSDKVPRHAAEVLDDPYLSPVYLRSKGPLTCTNTAMSVSTSSLRNDDDQTDARRPT